MSTPIAKETSIRVVNNDLNNAIKMPEPSVGDHQPATKPSIRDGGGIQWENYAKALKDGKTDESQFVDVLVTLRFPARLPPPSTSGQIISYVLKQKQDGSDPQPGVLDMFDSPPGAGTESGEKGHDYRTDPLQTIVNVSWGGGAVEFQSGGG